MSTNDDVPPHQLPRVERQKRIIMHLAANCNTETTRINKGIIRDLAITYGYSLAGIQKLWAREKEMALNRNSWANMDMMNWNNEHDEFDAAAVEGAVDYPQQEETNEEPTTAD